MEITITHYYDALKIMLKYKLDGIASSPGPFPAFQCCSFSLCSNRKLAMGLGMRINFTGLLKDQIFISLKA